MYKYFLLIALILCSFSVSAQWQQTGSKVRYVNGLGIPTKDTAAGVLADSSQILIRPADSSLYVKYKRTWMRVGGGGGSIAGSGTTNYIPKFTSSSAIGNSQIFDNGTNVGIGTITPSAKFDVNGVIRNNDRILANANNTNGTASINTFFNNTAIAQFCNFTNVASATQYGYMQGSDGTNYIGGSKNVFEYGNVGIGTTSPGYKFDVRNDVPASTSLEPTTLGLFNNNDGGSAIYFRNGVNGQAKIALGVESTGAGTDDTYLGFNTSLNASLSEKMRITSGGNVGIGTTSPAAKLSVQGTTLINTNTDNGVDKLQVSGSMSVSTLATTNNLSVTTNATVGGTATIQGNTQINGLIGVNTTPSSYALSLRQSGSNIVQFGTQSTSNINQFLHSSSTVFGQIGNAAGALSGGSNNDIAVGAVGASNNLVLFSNSVERMRVTASGRLLANTTTDNTIDQLQVNGSVLSTQYKLSALNTAPASATAAGTTGEIRIDANYIYICTATNTWKRVAIATW